MLTITYNGHNIPLDSEFALRLTYVNPVCYFDQVPGNYGMGIDIPVNYYSQAILGSPNRFEKYSSGSDRKFEDVSIRFAGVLLMNGTLNITSANQESYTGWLQSTVGVIGEEEQERFITELDWEENVDFENKVIYNEDTDNYCPASVKNGIWWEEKGATMELPKAYYDEDGKYNETKTNIGKLTWDHIKNYYRWVNYNPYGLGVVTAMRGAVVSPMLWLTYVIEQIFKGKKLFLGANAFKNVIDLTGMVVYNTWSIYKTYPIWFIETHNVFDSEYEPTTPPVPGVDLPEADPNEFWIEEHTNTISDLQLTMSDFNYRDLLPQISLKDFIVGLQNYFNVAFWWRPDGKIDIIMREHVIEGKVWDEDTETYVTVATFDLNNYFTGSWIVGEQKDVTLKFVQEYDKEDRMFGQEFHDLTDRRDDFADAVDTKAELDAIITDDEGTLRLVRDENKIYEWKWTAQVFLDANFLENQIDVLKWDFVSTGPQPYLYGMGDDVEEIKSGLSTLIKIDTDAVALQKGNMASTRSLWNEFSFRVGYAYAATDYKLDTENSLSGATLNWEGDNGIFKKRWETWSRFWSSRLPVEAEFDLPLNVLYYVVNNITRKFKTKHGEFIIEEMETEIGLNMVGKTRIKGYKL
jgi:hypothetical protein